MTGSDDEPQRTRSGGEPEVAATGGLAGRVREIAVLRTAVQDLVAGRGRLLMLSGEPGIGKTRLAEETARYATAHGVHVLWGRCWEGGGAPAFWPWIQLVRGALGVERWSEHRPPELSQSLSHIARMVPELRSTLGSSEPAREPETDPSPVGAPRAPEPERFRLFDAITNLFKSLAGETRLMIVVDDLHAADEDSLLLLRFLARELTQSPILVVATYREVEVRQSATHAALLSEIGREGATVPLRGLSLDEVADFIHRLHNLTADRELVSSLHKATGGNPFFLDEIVRLISAERDPDQPNRPVVDFAIPDSIRTAIRHRLQPLSDRTR